jgi:farnesyl-diphosphate farnesyltransferase
MADLTALLEKTSRTFALSIPLLPEPTRAEVTVAYLLFRIADTLEDAAAWPRQRRVAALTEYAGLLEMPAARRRRWSRRLSRSWCGAVPSEHAGYLELLAATPAVLDGLTGLSAEAQGVIARDTGRTARGMAGFVARYDDGGRLELADEEDLARYCYVVAGIVGEMLTDLFLLHHAGLAARAAFLRRRAALFGEALQLVNILKDSAADVEEGRSFLPRGVAREAVFRRARRDLQAAGEYVLCLQDAMEEGVERGLVAFCALPVRLAWATLERVERSGAGAKLTRPEVYRIAAELERALDSGEPAAPGAAPPTRAACRG